ncbi:ParA family protein [Rossellomorea marisflavi]|uniref:ParA family protein n=1 Tax=Rossellomorea marisflavi TaxID=189381 RepID=UPI00190F9E3C|nr:ParA family protein [Rossellomorea marisflavi]
MIIGVYSAKTAYKEQFESREEIELAVLSEKFKNETVKFDALLVDGASLPFRELETARYLYPDIPIFYQIFEAKSEIAMRDIHRIGAAQKIAIINEYYTLDQVIDEVITAVLLINNKPQKRVVTFYGTHSSVGVSTTTLNVARSLSAKTSDRVLVLSLNAWDPADYFYDYKGEHLNDLKVDLKTKSLTPLRLNEALHQYKDFYHLAGNRDIKIQRYFTPEEVKHLLDVAKESFDIILVDGGTHFDTAIAAQTFLSSDLKFLVTTQEDKGFRGYFPYVFQQMLEPVGGKKEDFMLIINRFQSNMSLISEKDLEADLEMSRLTTIADMGPLGSISIRQNNLMYEEGETAYTKPIDSISNLIIAEAGLAEKVIDPSSNKSRGLLGIWGNKKAKGAEKVW